jgi:predicted PurR-regulated permease PerM
MKIKVTNANRIVSSVLTISGAILFFVVSLVLGYFLYDEDKLEYKLPRISHNPFFNICDHIRCKDSIYSNILIKIVFNSSLISFFWFQHILMANNRFKIFLTNFTNYPTYERGLYILSKIT